MKTKLYRIKNRRIIIGYTFLLVLFFATSMPTFSDSEQEISADEQMFQEASDAYRNQNYNLAFDKFLILAKQGMHDAQYNLAVILKSGKGVPKDYSEALFWSWRARLGGVSLAIDQSEELIAYVPEKSLKAIRERVMDSLNVRIFNGDGLAIRRLANYFLVIVAEPDYEKAYLWFLVSAALLQDGGLEGRDEVELQLDSEMVIKIQKEAYDLFLSLPDSVKNNSQNVED